MSRIGNKTILVPSNVKVELRNQEIIVSGPRGKLQFELPKNITADVSQTEVLFHRSNDEPSNKALHGLTRSLVNNMILGVSNGFTKNLEIQGVGFKAVVQSKVLNLSLGKSHPILFSIPDSITITVQDNTKIKVEGIDLQLVGQVAANIRAYYPPEPYKGKGVRYVGEKVIRKEGKTVQ